MAYDNFFYNNENIGSLTKREIKNPLSVLEDIFKRRGLQDFKKNLWEYFLIIFRDQRWRINGAPYYYSIYRDLIRLINAIRLINTCHPKLSRIYNDYYFASSSSCIEQNIFIYLQIGLNATYMSSNKYYYFTIKDKYVIADFMGLESLIEVGQNICMKSKTMVQNSINKKHLKFASDCDHAINDPIDLISFAFDHMFIFERFAESLKMWEKSFYKINFWLNENGPGNMLFFAKTLKEIIESIWLLVQQDYIGISIEIKKLTTKEKKLYPALNENELTQPYMTIKSFFEHKKMHEWKTELDVWTNISLSDTETILDENIDTTSINLHHLLRFIEASHLVTYNSRLKERYSQ